MSESLLLLTLTALSVGFVHTLIGPDHYLPFVMMARAGKWSGRKTLLVTLLCGVGHVMSSVVIGMVGIALGIAVAELEGIEGTRGGIAAWLLVGFGLVYGTWGLHRAMRNRPHTHAHFHEDGIAHRHDHNHHYEHAHVHDADRKALTAWALFTVFVLGPCEPLIPILMYPAARHSLAGVAWVTLAFAVVTIATMLTVVWFGLRGVSLIRATWLERYVHALAGFIVAGSGLAIQVLGL